MILYESHLGGLYLSDEPIDPEYLYCEQCGDSDFELGEVETFDDILELVTKEDGFIPWTDEALQQIKREIDAYRESEE